MTLLVAITDGRTGWLDAFRNALPDRSVVTPDDPAAALADYAVVWNARKADLAACNNLKAVFSYGAGVDGVLASGVAPDGLPLVRFVDDTMTRTMRDYVVSQVTLHHRLQTRFIDAQRNKVWAPTELRTAEDISVGILGLGVLGETAACALVALGYQVNGWSRRPRTIEGVTCHSGRNGLAELLSQSDILVCLLPLTDQTRGILNADLFRALRRDRLEGGPVVINAARGGHLVMAELAAALRDGTLGAASVDVFETEPLAPDNPVWDLQNCLVTPHIAAPSGQAALANYVARQISAHESGQPLENLVDRQAGY